MRHIKKQKYWDIVQIFKFISFISKAKHKGYNKEAENHTLKRTLQ
jgi:hypothetical protein